MFGTSLRSFLTGYFWHPYPESEVFCPPTCLVNADVHGDKKMMCLSNECITRKSIFWWSVIDSEPQCLSIEMGNCAGSLLTHHDIPRLKRLPIIIDALSFRTLYFSVQDWDAITWKCSSATTARLGTVSWWISCHVLLWKTSEETLTQVSGI